jgi:hypothetical protein
MAGLALLSLGACAGRSHPEAHREFGVGGSPGGALGGGGPEASGAPNQGGSGDLGGAGGEPSSDGREPGDGGAAGASEKPTLTGPMSGVPACAAVGQSTTLTCIDLDASALLADAARGKLYAVVKGGASQHANELVVIDPEAATVEASVVVGSDPAALALSDDGTRLWVSLEGALALREVDLTRSPPEPGAQYPLPRLYDAAYAATLVVLPGAPESVAFAYRYEHLSPSAADAVLVDSGMPRAKRLRSPPGIAALALGPAGYLFGLDDDGPLISIAVDAEGLTATSHASVLRASTSSLAYDDGFLFTTAGEVVDVTSPDAPKVAGTFPESGLVVPHAADSGAVVLTSTYDPSAYDATMPTSTTQALNALVLRHLSLASFSADRELKLDGHYYDVVNLVEPKPGLFAFVDYQVPRYPNSRTVRAGVIVVSAPELSE